MNNRWQQSNSLIVKYISLKINSTVLKDTKYNNIRTPGSAGKLATTKSPSTAGTSATAGTPETAWMNATA
jgi:hypothetical protein